MQTSNLTPRALALILVSVLGLAPLTSFGSSADEQTEPAKTVQAKVEQIERPAANVPEVRGANESRPQPDAGKREPRSALVVRSAQIASRTVRSTIYNVGL